MVRGCPTPGLLVSRAFTRAQARGRSTGLVDLLPVRQADAPANGPLLRTDQGGRAPGEKARREGRRRLSREPAEVRVAGCVRVDRTTVRIQARGIPRSRSPFAIAPDHAVHLVTRDSGVLLAHYGCAADTDKQDAQRAHAVQWRYRNRDRCGLPGHVAALQL